MTVHRKPTADDEVSLALVRRLLAEQHPDLAGRPVEVLANGWDILVCRLGADLLVRLPRRAAAAELLAHEQRWLPELAGRLPLPVPAPVRVGRPARGFPWSWSVVPFLPGDIAAHATLADPEAAALGGFLAALHLPAAPDAPVNVFRGIPLAGRAEGVHAGVALLADASERAAALRVWQTAVTAPARTGPPLWIHGDLHPANILVDAGRITAVIDFGDLTSGDPATDLAVAWMLFPDAHRRSVLRRAYGRVDDPTWTRARGWALVLALVLLAHSADNPLMAGIGERTLRAVLADEDRTV
jgi:aminoglycoside phosphotransferase (APT) family kinase protein